MSEYIGALLAHWVSLMSGIVSVLFGVGLRIGKRTSAKMKNWSDVPDWIFVLVGIGCLFLSGYQAWSDEHTALVGLQDRLRTPDIQIEGTSIWWGDQPDGTILVVCSLNIANPLGPPTALDHWKFDIQQENGAVTRGTIPLLRESRTLLSIDKTPSHALVLKTNENVMFSTSDPISAGGLRSGWIMGRFPGGTLIKRGTTIVMSADDVVQHKSHLLRYPIERENPGITLP